ncbi:DedA family protein [Campylobacter sp. MIT 21-1685]|uniref:DedA family protein n=1 Tax=unclassified Campylobacter TaxID=2593542 RepID=UPI00224B9443|nr:MULTISPECIES: DedA family protein [unclassified Campylobacter]MCX2683675.1 DedA family protein [Campylobacter sp. MIT 21-1684]MCX2751960.1 DedA family protein [Campylobacter sp. MIT 21-1682]MCX2808178.1 DedA family protein [Campylobacter sp. MIT 21-1685]
MISFILEQSRQMGYLGIVLLMSLESSFIPFPSEIVMIPAGYLASKGELNPFLCIFFGVLGSVLGALINYFLCYFYGKKIVLKYGKYVGITEAKFQKFEQFFHRHGEISTFSCRLLPGIRQYISLPAGIAKMKLFNFIFFTALGSTIWVSILVALGFFIGENEKLIAQYLQQILIILIVTVLCIIIIYIQCKKSKTQS